MHALAKCWICLFFLLQLVFSQSIPALAEPGEDPMLQQEALNKEAAAARERRDELQESIEKRDFKNAATLVQNSYDTWRKPCEQRLREWRASHLEMMVSKCGSYVFPESNAIGIDYARQALAHPDEMSAVVELGFTLRAIDGVLAPREPNVPRSPVDPAARARSAKYCCHALARFHEEYDPGWKPDLEPHRIYPGFSGPDAELQAEWYRKQIRDRGWLDVKQKGLHSAKRSFVPWIERHLGILYSVPPWNKDEPRKVLERVPCRPGDGQSYLESGSDTGSSGPCQVSIYARIKIAFSSFQQAACQNMARIRRVA